MKKNVNSHRICEHFQKKMYVYTPLKKGSLVHKKEVICFAILDN